MTSVRKAHPSWPSTSRSTKNARHAILHGVDAVADAVRATLGPRGRNVVIDRAFGAPTITNDGVTVAREIDLENPSQNVGAQLVKEVATKTNDVAGDGTSTATVLAQAMIAEGMRTVTAGANPIELKRGIEQSDGRGRPAPARARHSGRRLSDRSLTSPPCLRRTERSVS